MAFEDTFRLSSHAVIFNHNQDVLVLKANYGEYSWGLPGGALDPGETIHDALYRECIEELGCEVEVKYLSGVYYHSAYNSQAFIFRCEIKDDHKIQLSDEHSEFRYSPLDQLSTVQQKRVADCRNYNGNVLSGKF
jgi:8-oxo-dGTP pyrophosphatase MutT (NUDIX family)